MTRPASRWPQLMVNPMGGVDWRSVSGARWTVAHHWGRVVVHWCHVGVMRVAVELGGAWWCMRRLYPLNERQRKNLKCCNIFFSNTVVLAVHKFLLVPMACSYCYYY